MSWLGLSPALVWGLLSRSTGAVFAVAFVSIGGQVLALAGRNGIAPVALKLARMRADFGWRRFLYWPGLLWVSDSDQTLSALVWLGAGASIAVMVGGPAAPWALLASYVCYLSLDLPLGLKFPWESALFEAAFLALWLPPTLPLPHLAAVSAPDPAIAWAYRLLVFRIVFGFGKFKFLGSHREDAGFLKGFLINQPLPSRVAWFAHRLPLPVLKLGLVCLFVVEIPIALLALLPGTPSVIAAVSIVALMAVIQANGNFGHFNLVVAILCLPLLDASTPTHLTLASLFASRHAVAVTLVVAVHTLGAALCFPFNSYFTHSWHQWPAWYCAPRRWILWPIFFFRALHPLRWLHPYGVFPPRSMADVRCVAVVEVTWDGIHWRELEYRFASTRPDSIPGFIAPHHPRWDQGVIYLTYLVTDCGLVWPGLAGSAHPYQQARYTESQCLLQRILEGHTYEGVVFKRGTFPADRGRPVGARMRTYMMVPTAPEERRRTGHWWTRTCIASHCPPTRLDSRFWDDWLPEPELFHCESLVWRRRSHLDELARRAVRGEDPGRAIRVDATDIDERDVEAFWSEFLPAAEMADREDWARLPRTVAAIRRRFPRHRLRTFERILGRLSAMLEARLEPLMFGHGLEPPLGVRTHLHASLLIQVLIGDGRTTYEAAMKDPPIAVRRAKRLTVASGVYLWAIFKFDLLAGEARKIRLLDAMLARCAERAPDSARGRSEIETEAMLAKVWGVFDVASLLRRRFAGPEYETDVPERLPEFDILPSGDLVSSAQSRRRPRLSEERADS
ncbi:MAG TPA: lipase maturation factor family protein [Polyangiaceae bacterium]|nr:lipase maturation factor family protein [Polyangiaceae bacterium]